MLTAILGMSHDAAAFCRSTTCDSRKETCPRDDSYCLTTGAPLYWASRCLFFVVHEAGAPTHGIFARRHGASRPASIPQLDAGGLRWGPPVVSSMGCDAGVRAGRMR